MSEVEINQQIADQICKMGSLNGKQYLLGQCVALLEGKVAAVANDLQGALRALRGLDANPERGMVFEVVPPITDVIR